MRKWRAAAGLAVGLALLVTAVVFGSASVTTAKRAGGVAALGNSYVKRESAPRQAQSAKASAASGPQVGNAQFYGVSPALRDLPSGAPLVRSAPRNEREVPPTRTAVPATDPVVQTQAGSAPMPDTTVNFNALCDTPGVGPVGSCTTDRQGCGGCLPPDTNGEVGPTQYVQMVNTNIAVFSKTGTVLKPSTAINLLWPSGPCRSNNDGDPVVLYDQLAGRWLVSQFIANAPYGECIAISTTGDATGTYYLYSFTTDGVVGTSGTFYDYPHLGVWPDAYYMTANEFPPNFQLSQGYGAFAFERAKMLLGQPARMIFFDAGQTNPPGSTFYAGALPSDADGAIPPPTGEPNFIAEVDDLQTLPAPPTGTAGYYMRLWKFHVDWSNPANSTFGSSGNPNYILPVDPFVRTLCVYGLPNYNCVPQKNGAEGLDALNDRLMFRLAYRNFGANPPTGIPANTESLVLNGTVNTPDATNPTHNVMGIRWYEVRNPNGNGGSPAVYQQGSYAPNDDPTHVLWRWMGSVAMDHVGNMAAGYSASGPNDFPSIRYAGRLVDSPLGVLDQTEKTVAAPYSGPQTNVEGRWGDYSDLTIDPSDDCTFWYTQEYLVSDLVVIGDWQTRVAAFKFPSCTGGPTAVSITRFTSRWTKAGVRLDWRTASEAPTAGYNLWRSSGKSWQRVNPTLIPGRARGAAPASYRFVDRTAKARHYYSYRLQLVDLTGKRSWYGVGTTPTRS